MILDLLTLRGERNTWRKFVEKIKKNRKKYDDRNIIVWNVLKTFILEYIGDREK